MNALVERVLDHTIESYEVRGTDEDGRIHVRLSHELFASLVRSGYFNGQGFINARDDKDKTQTYYHRFSLGNVDYFCSSKARLNT